MCPHQGSTHNLLVHGSNALTNDHLARAICCFWDSFMLLCLFIFYSFLLLSNILLYEYVTIYPFHSWQVVGLFLVWDYCEQNLYEHHVQVIVFISHGQIPRTGLMNNIVSVYLALWDIAKLFFWKWLCHFAFSPELWAFQLLYIFTNTWYCQLFSFLPS